MGNENTDVTQATDTKESGGVVTTVRSNESQDQDFQTRLKQANADAGGDGDKDDKDDKSGGDKDGKPNGKAKDEEDWQASLSEKGKREVQKLYDDRRKTSREIRELRESVSRLEAKTAESKGEQRQPEPSRDPLKKPERPDPTKFNSDKEYNDALDRYDEDMHAYRKAKDAADAAAEKQRQAIADTVDKFNTAVTELIKDEEFKDYEDVMDNANNEVSDLMFGAIMTEGPALAYYFATHPEESAKIARMRDEAQAIKAITRITIKLEDAAEAKKKKSDDPPPNKDKDKQSEIQNPPRHVGGKQTVVVQKDRSKMSFKEREAEFAKRNPGVLKYQT